MNHDYCTETPAFNPMIDLTSLLPTLVVTGSYDDILPLTSSALPFAWPESSWAFPLASPATSAALPSALLVSMPATEAALSFTSTDD